MAEEEHPCPVCGFPLYEPVTENGLSTFVLCSCCMTQFGHDELGSSPEALRQKWIEEGMPWRGVEEHKPDDWSAARQLVRLEEERPKKSELHGEDQ
ncbi:hypothetical protein FF098_011395 [Parvularcula flava]|uniref:Restriction alleviation protein, Lar family n=1 Tax=Aquisalinus luteolus TaxID=1566827 RepID=A0ABX0HK88_9PROT|nr:hypothetical protein [Aquisalinus luteolus]NHK28512.1 hypothetical protein [Aquisalinus luteolus]